MRDLCHRAGNYYRLCSAVLGYVSMSQEANIKLLVVIGEHTMFVTRKILG